MTHGHVAHPVCPGHGFSDSEVITDAKKKALFIALRLSFDMIHLYGKDLIT